MAKITYEDKEFLNKNESIADKNKVNDTDLNQIKEAVNQNDDNVGDLSNLNTTDKTSLVNAINEVNIVGKFIKLTRSSNQKFSANSQFEIMWDKEISNNTNGILIKNGNQIQCTNGTHNVLIIAHAQMNGTGTNYIYINHNGSHLANMCTSNGGSTLISTVTQLKANDYLLTDAYSTLGGSVGYGEEWASFMVILLD